MTSIRSVGKFAKVCSVFAVGAFLLGSMANLSQGAVPKSDSKVKISARASRPKASGQQVIALTLNIDKDWYIYANPVGLDLFEPNATKITVKSRGRAIAARVIYPKGKAKNIGNLKYHTYQGTTTIHVVVQRPAGASALRVDVQLNACGGKKNVCLDPGVKSIVIQ